MLPSTVHHQLPSCILAFSLGFLPSAQADLVALYEFEDNGDDSIGDADGTVGSAVTFDDGLIGRSAVFPSSGFDSTDTINAPAFDPGDGDFTIAFWIKRDDDDLDADGIFDALNNTGEGFQANFRREPGDPGDAASGHMAFRVDDSSGQFLLIVDPGEVNDSDTWHHYALTIDRTEDEAKIYRDGQLAITESSAELTGTISPDQDIVIGGLNNAGNLGLEGQLDDLRFYDEALDAAAIAELATPPDPVPVRPLIITEITPTESTVTLTWNSKADADYAIFYTADLATPREFWSEATDSVPSDGEETTHTLSGFELPELPLPAALFFIVVEN